MKTYGRRGKTARSLEWPTVLLIFATYGAWALLGSIVWPAYPVVAIVAFGFVLALQSSLMHEACHGHPTRKAWANELLVGLPIGLVWPYRRFRSIHLRHHADECLTDPFDDPESYYQSLWQHETLPEPMKRLLAVNNTMFGRMLLNPLLGSVGFFLNDMRAIAAGDRAVREAWLLHGLGLAIVVPVVLIGFGIPLWAYLLAVWLGQSLISVRTFAEHQWSERPDGRTIIVERSPFAFLFLNNNLHLVHHKNPTVAWYKLPEMFRARRDEWLAMNHGYVFPNYLALLKSYGFRAKEPVVHPALRRAPEMGRAFKPRVRARSLNGMGSVPVPAEPPKE
ncbi:fatty acid desaturase [Mesorhizobium sp. IMUNJ 23232]|uniref:fatty acid desaturase n=1 Tax=Mesorhizobium sp. IMUNJ 23232 TaxID=3376064 RepID=UPI00378CD223